MDCAIDLWPFTSCRRSCGGAKEGTHDVSNCRRGRFLGLSLTQKGSCPVMTFMIYSWQGQLCAHLIRIHDRFPVYLVKSTNNIWLRGLTDLVGWSYFWHPHQGPCVLAGCALKRVYYHMESRQCYISCSFNPLCMTPPICMYIADEPDNWLGLTIETLLKLL